MSGQRQDVASGLREPAGLPYDPHRTKLYTPDELLKGAPDSLDARIYTHYKAHGGRMPDKEEALDQRLHDLSIEIARDSWIGDREQRHIVGVMGGHDLKRGTDGYRTAANLGRALARAGRLVVTGGGPGAMEAANLGAFLAGFDSEEELDDAILTLKAQPDWTKPDYGSLALEVFEKYEARGRENLSIPTWYYGFEPTNPFATGIAKYFSNSLREDGLVTIALDGVIYLAGRAGTVQEIFQDAAQNYYGADYARSSWVSPMVFLPASQASDQALVDQVVALVREVARLAQPRNTLFAEAVASVPDVESAVEFIRRHPPQLMPEA